MKKYKVKCAYLNYKEDVGVFDNFDYIDADSPENALDIAKGVLIANRGYVKSDGEYIVDDADDPWFVVSLCFPEKIMYYVEYTGGRRDFVIQYSNFHVYEIGEDGEEILCNGCKNNEYIAHIEFLNGQRDHISYRSEYPIGSEENMEDLTEVVVELYEYLPSEFFRGHNKYFRVLCVMEALEEK